MPTNPTFHWGNFLLFQSAPRAGDFGRWMAAYEEEFGPDAGHVTFGWDAPEMGEVEAFTANRFAMETLAVLEFEGGGAAFDADLSIDVRAITTDAEWDAVVDLQVLVGVGETANDAYRAFKTNLFRTYRRMSEAGRGHWWGAFRGDRLIGDMGLFFDPRFSMGRFQSVETHPDFRRRGVCSKLLATVLRTATAAAPQAQLVICADSDSSAERLYRRAGFRHRETQYGVSLPCPFARRFDSKCAVPEWDSTPPSLS